MSKKLENVQASMYADVVDANMKNRRLRRALWNNLQFSHEDIVTKYIDKEDKDGSNIPASKV